MRNWIRFVVWARNYILERFARFAIAVVPCLLPTARSLRRNVTFCYVVAILETFLFKIYLQTGSCSFLFLFITLLYRQPQLSLCYFLLFLTLMLPMHTLVAFLFHYISDFSKNIVMGGQIGTQNILVYFYHFKFFQGIISNLLKKVCRSFLNNRFKIV